MPRKTGNSDPSKGQKQTVSGSLVGECCVFILENSDNPEAFREVAEEDREFWLDIVEHMIAIRMGGWKLGEDTYVNEGGRTANTKNWDLTEDGYLSLKGKNVVLSDTDWLHEIRSAIEDSDA